MTHPELVNLSLFARAIAKTATMCLWPAPLALPWIRSMGRSFFSPVKRGQVYLVAGYHTGDFIGRVEKVDRDVARIRVLDPMRPIPRVRNRCAYPECVAEDFHADDHRFASVREGAVVDVFWRSVTFKQVSGDGQLAKATVDLMPAVLNRARAATSPFRKARRA